MALIYQCDNSVIEQVLKKMKKHGVVAQDAGFNKAAADQLRQEVTYRDLDFLLRLARTKEVEIVDSIYKFLKLNKLIEEDKYYDKGLFTKFRKEVHDKFKVPWTSLTPVMERLLFMLASVKAPKNVFAAGIFCGNTLIWNAAPVMLRSDSDGFTRILGVDIDETAIDLAKSNFNSLNIKNSVELLCEDALISAAKINYELDYIYLDADSMERGKKIYLDILKILHPKLKKNGWVLAHDTTEWCFEKDFRDYKAFVRNKANFKESVSFDIDPYGLELSIK